MKKMLPLILVSLFLFSAIVAITIMQTKAERGYYMDGATHILKPYTGVGSGVFKHGTIVKVVDGKAVVVGHFDDESGASYPGTMQIAEVK